LTSTDRVARAVFVLLVIACFAAFFVTQRLKHTPTVLQTPELTPSFSPSAAPPQNMEKISFKVAHADQATVTIIDSQGDAVATLVRDYPVARYKQFSLRWNGRRGTARRYGELRTASGHPILLPDNEGAPAPAGEYRVRVSLLRQGRPVLFPRSFTLLGR
jgi:hypothetical protein